MILFFTSLSDTRSDPVLFNVIEQFDIERANWVLRLCSPLLVFLNEDKHLKVLKKRS